MSIKSCSHAETYRIVISDAAKIGIFLLSSKCFDSFFAVFISKSISFQTFSGHKSRFSRPSLLCSFLLHDHFYAPVAYLDDGHAACWEAGSYHSLSVTADACASLRAVNAIDAHLLTVVQPLNSHHATLALNQYGLSWHLADASHVNHRLLVYPAQRGRSHITVVVASLRGIDRDVVRGGQLHLCCRVAADIAVGNSRAISYALCCAAEHQLAILIADGWRGERKFGTVLAEIRDGSR